MSEAKDIVICEKQQFLSKKEALIFIKQIKMKRIGMGNKRTEVGVYLCRHCKLFHVSSSK